MKLGIALVGLFSLPALAGNAAADVVATRAIIVGQSDAEAAWTTRPTEARLGDAPRLAVVLAATERRGKRKRTVYIADPAIRPLVVGRRTIRERSIRPWSVLPDDTTTRWLTVEPHAWRTESTPAANGNTRRFHSNVSMESGSFGQWLGYDTITYFATEVAKARTGARARLRAATITPSDPEVRGKTRLGTIRYQAVVQIGETTLATPGVSAVDRAGILPSVHRVSIRSDDSFVGHLTAFLLVPEVFGSAGRGRHHQTDRYTGADCADVLTGAARASGMRHIKYTSVAGLTRFARVVVAPVEVDKTGTPARAVTEIERGDIIRINYGGSLAGHTPRSWDHVAVLFEDRSDPEGPHEGAADGVLDGFDLVAHMGHPRLVIEPLRRQVPATIDVLRWKARKR